VGRDARHHFLDAQRLGHVVDGAAGEPGELVDELVERGHEDDGNGLGGRERLQAPAGLEAVHAGHHYVEQDQVGQHEARALDALLAILRDHDPEAALREVFGERPDVLRRVVDDEDRAAHLRAPS
jgi:hypothetical protein